MTPTVRRILLSQSLEKRIQNIVKNNSIAMYVPAPGVTCFQDSACTIPAAVDDPVGGLKDYLGLYPATQATAGYKPILRGAVKNQIIYSNNLDNASWVKANLAESASGVGWALATSTSNTEHVILQSFASAVITSYTIQCKIKANGYNGISVGFWGSAFNGLDNAYFADSLVRAVQFDLLNGTIVQKPSYLSATITPLGSDEYLVSVTANNTTGTDIQARLYMKNTNANVTYHTFTGDGVSGVIIRDVQVNIGDVLPYVATTSSPASSSYGPYWLDFDGFDDVLSISGLSAFTSAAVIKSVKNTGYSIQTEQDISAGYSFNTALSNALMLAKSTPSSSELAVIKKYFDRLAGVA